MNDASRANTTCKIGIEKDLFEYVLNSVFRVFFSCRPKPLVNTDFEEI